MNQQRTYVSLTPFTSAHRILYSKTTDIQQDDQWVILNLMTLLPSAHRILYSETADIQPDDQWVIIKLMTLLTSVHRILYSKTTDIQPDDQWGDYYTSAKIDLSLRIQSSTYSS